MLAIIISGIICIVALYKFYLFLEEEWEYKNKVKQCRKNFDNKPKAIKY